MKKSFFIKKNFNLKLKFLSARIADVSLLANWICLIEIEKLNNI